MYPLTCLFSFVGSVSIGNMSSVCEPEANLSKQMARFPQQLLVQPESEYLRSTKLVWHSFHRSANNSR